MNENLNIYQKLLASYQPEQPLTSRKNISTKENGTRYTAVVTPPRDTVIFQVDGYIIKNGNRCDKLILSIDASDSDKWHEYFIELKGHDVKHALKQLKSTLELKLFEDKSVSKKYARIVGSSFPSNAGDPEFEKAKRDFKTQFKCELKKLKSNQPDRI